ncbi:MAG: hypothetical protein K2X38_14200 [Gemmataceae bacterium]|nr:hypothetical protein [Gemmataceae bacterium]
MLRGWANCFRRGAASAADRIVDNHACFRLRQWLGRRNACRARVDHAARNHTCAVPRGS